MERQPQNPEFRINHENFDPCYSSKKMNMSPGALLLIRFFTSNQQSFSNKGTGLPGLNQY